MTMRRQFALLLFLLFVPSAKAQPSTTVERQTSAASTRSELNPQARVAFHQGLDFLEAKDYKKAINAFGSAVKIHPRNGQFRHLLGVAYFRNRQGGRAWLQFRKAVILSPKYTAATHDFESAWAVFQRQGVFAIGRTQEEIAKLVGEPDAKGGDSQQEFWQYGFMRLQFVKGRLGAIIDPRGVDKALQTHTHAMKIEFDDWSRWKLGHRGINRLHTLSEYVPRNETVRSWTEMVQVQRLHKMASNRTPPELMNSIEEKLKASDSTVSFAVLAENDQEAMFHWNTPGTKDQPAQHEIVRLLRGPRDVHRVAYTRRVAQIPQAEAQRWLNLLQKAKLTPTSVQSSPSADE